MIKILNKNLKGQKKFDCLIFTINMSFYKHQYKCDIFNVKLVNLIYILFSNYWPIVG